MPGPYLSFHVAGEDHLERVLERVSVRMSPEGMQVFNEGLVKSLEEYYKKNWPMGVANRLPQTDERWPDGSTLDLSGELMKSLTENTGNSVRVVTPYEIRFGTKLFYGRFINDGTVKMQPRPFLKLTTKLRTAIIQAVAQYVGFSPDLRYASGFRGL